MANCQSSFVQDCLQFYTGRITITLLSGVATQFLTQKNNFSTNINWFALCYEQKFKGQADFIKNYAVPCQIFDLCEASICHFTNKIQSECL